MTLTTTTTMTTTTMIRTMPMMKSTLVLFLQTHRQTAMAAESDNHEEENSKTSDPLIQAAKDEEKDKDGDEVDHEKKTCNGGKPGDDKDDEKKGDVEKCDEDGDEKKEEATPEMTPFQKRRKLRSAALFATYLFLGMTAGLASPSFLDLQLITKVNTDKLSATFTAGSLGYMIGSFFGGNILGRLPLDLVLFATFALSGVVTAVYPLCSIFYLMVVMSGVNCVMLGSFDTCGNAALLAMWGAKSGPYMQALHFFFSLGAVLSPLYVRPFLAPLLGNATLELQESNASICLQSNASSDCWQENRSSSATEMYGETQVHSAYIITACFVVAAAIPFLFFFLRDHVTRATKKQPEEAKKGDQIPLRYFLLGVILLDAMYFLYNPVEEGFTSFLVTFVVRQLGWKTGDGALLASVYWAAFSVGRFSGIFLQKLLKPITLLLIFGPMTSVSLVAFLLSARLGCGGCLWAATVLAGVAMSIIFPTGLVFAEQELFPVSRRIVSSVFITASAGVMINPLVLGNLMERYTYMWYTYLLLGESVLFNVILIVLILYGRLKLRKFRVKKDTEDMELTVKEPLTSSEKVTKDKDGLSGELAERFTNPKLTKDERSRSYLANWSDQYQEDASKTPGTAGNSRCSSVESSPSSGRVGRFYVRKSAGSPRKDAPRSNTARGRIDSRSKSQELLKEF